MSIYRGVWRRTVDATVEPVSLAEAKAHLRLDTGPLEDRLEPAPSIPPGDHAVVADYGLEGAGVSVTGGKSIALFDVGTIPGALTVDVKLQESSDDVTYTDVTGGAFSQVSSANDEDIYELEYTGPEPYLRAVATVTDGGGSTAPFGVSILVIPAALTDEDTYVTALITAARTHLEEITGRSFITQTWQLTLDEWGSMITLPRPPAASVTSITYTDTDGAEQTLAADQYTLASEALPGYILPAWGVSWPSLRDVPENVVVTYTAGFGDAAANVPETLRLAVKMLVAHWYENREPAVIGTSAGSVPFTVAALVAPYRVAT